ncbi:SDR family NAD(P)-dependent oxidoreductase [Pseudolysinimonas sp.]|uniref:SDR family NAD(P)-dependent oxidoreductase n=1 Tax=Pseudolysinimonas sp. TaxID=2680009 RepID=UPI003F7D9E3A
MTRIALITGGSRGLGRASALALAAHDVDVVLTYNSAADEAAAVVAEVEELGRTALALRLDTTTPATFAAFAAELRAVLRDRWGREELDVLLNNAGFAGDTPFGSTTKEQIDELVAVHLTGPLLLTQELSPLLGEGARILNVSTGLTQNLVNPQYAVYASMKGAVEVWTRYLAKELGPRGIRVNVIAPGATATDFAGGVIRDDERYQAAIAASSPLGRAGRPDDIGAAVAAILSEDLAWVTGQRIEASGGQGMGRWQPLAG